MSADPRLPRWSEEGSEAPAELRQWLRASREQLGAGDDVAQLSRSLAERLGAEAGLPSARLPAATGKPALALGRWAAWFAAGAVSVAAVWYWKSEHRAAPSAQPATVPPAAVQPVALPTPVALPPLDMPAAAPSIADTSGQGAGLTEPSQHSRPEPARERVRAKAPRTSEAELLQRAQSALVAHPAQALALTAEHRQWFAEGALAEEREVIAIEALRRLGRERAARDRAAVFEAKYPNSVHRSRVRATPAGQ